MRRRFPASAIAHLASTAFVAVAMLSSAHANEKLRVAKVVPFAWAFTPLDIGIQAGIFAKHGLDIEESASAGDECLEIVRVGQIQAASETCEDQAGDEYVAQRIVVRNLLFPA